MTKIAVEFDDLWTLKENLKGMENRVQKIRKITKSIHIKEILIDEGLTDCFEKNNRILSKYMSTK